MKKAFIIAVILLVAFVLARETGIWNFNFYKSEVTNGTTYVWNRGQQPKTEADSARLQENRQIRSGLGFKVIYKGDTILRENRNSPNQVEIVMGKIFTENLWTPLYKKSEISCNSICIFPNSILKHSMLPPGFVLEMHNKSFFTNRTFIFTGLCSHREALKAIRQYIATSLIEEIKFEFDNME